MNNSGLLVHAVLDEIALEGLDGITIKSLWIRLSVRLNFPLPLNENFCNQIWSFLLKKDSLFYYELPEPRPDIKIFARCDYNENDYDTEECPFTVYKFNPISIQKLRGSCQDFHTRIIIDLNTIRHMSLQEITEKYGDKLVIVGTQQMREWAIFPESIPPPKDLSLFQYCILERIARSRHNGEKTNGKFSMADLMDSSKAFYIRKILFRHKLIVRQPYVERIVGPGNSSTGSLLHLPRFYSEYKTKQMTLTEQIIEILKAEPNCMMEYSKLRLHFDKNLYGSIKKLRADKLFQKFVRSDSIVKYRELYPNAPASDWQKKNKSEERELRVMQLHDPNLDVNDMWPRENIADDNDDAAYDTLDVTNQLIDETLLRQTYKCIEKSGKNGISSTDICQYLGLTKLNCRLILRNLERLQKLSKFYVDKGRQRLAMYVTNENKPNDIVIENDESILNAVDATGDHEISATSQLKKEQNSVASSSSISECTEKSSLADFDVKSISSDTKLPEGWQLIDVTVKIELIEKFNLSKINKGNVTARLAERLNIILRSIKKHLIIVHIHQLTQAVNKAEAKMGLESTMCRKSMNRLISRLSIEKRIRLWQILLTYEKHAKTCMFICDITINIDNPLFISMLEREKEIFLRRILNAQMRAQAVDRQRIEEQMYNNAGDHKSMIDKRTVKKSTELAPKKKIIKDENGQIDRRMLNYGVTPKFIKMRTLHEFMFYLVYDEAKPMQQIVKPLHALEHWKNCEPLVNYDELMLNPLPVVYSIDLDWKTFVSPLGQNHEFGNGWILMSDLILRLPLSIFIKLINITVEIPGLDEYLEHPIRKHFLLKYIPAALQNELLKGRKHLFTIDETMRRLCCIGLVQMGPQLSKDKDQVFVYLNRRANLLDTISSEPGYYQCTPRQYPRYDYYFSVNDNIQEYWQQLYKICTNTRLNRRNTPDNIGQQIKAWNLQPVLMEHMLPRLASDVEQFDTGETPGDHLGAGGLDSSLFSHLLRNWSLTRYKIKARSPMDDNAEDGNDGDAQNSDNSNDDAADEPTETKKISFKRTVKKKLTRVNNKVNIVKRTQKGKQGPAVATTKSTSRELIKKATKKLRQPLYNEIDKMALNQMTKLRVDWSTEEDTVILFCKVAMLYLCPNPRKQGVPMCTVRDILQWLLKSNDKTSRACQRRIVYMMKNPTTASNVHMCLLEVQHNARITETFPPNLYERMREKFAHEDGFIRAMRIVFVDLVVMLRKYFVTLTKTKLDEQLHLFVPDTIDEFKRMYIEHSEDYQNECVKYFKPTKRTDIEVDVLCALIHSSVCCALDKTSWSVQLYDIYKNYPDRLLLMAMEKVRNYQMISAKKTVTKSRLKATENLPLSSSPYHLSVSYQYQFMTSISYDIFYDIYLCNKAFFAAQSDEQTMKFTNITPGRCIAFIQLLHNQNIEFNIEVPPKMLVIDKSYCDSAFERTDSKFRQIIDNVPNLALDQSQLSSSSNPIDAAGMSDNTKKDNKKRRVMINTEHEKIEYHMSPVEKLMKLDDSMLHFYCLFRQIGTAIDLNSIEIELPGRYCSFDCVLREPEPILAMIDMIKLDAGNVMKQISIDNQTDALHDTMTIDINNILVIFGLLVSKLFNTDDFDFEDVSDYGVLSVSAEILNDNTDNDLWFSSASKVDNDAADNNSHQDTDFVDGKMTQNILGNYSHENPDKIHNYFYVRTCKLLINCGKIDPLKIHQLSMERKSMVLKKTISDAVWKKNPLDNDAVTQALSDGKCTDDEIKFTMEVLKFIELKEDIGAENSELIAEFSSDKTMLLRAIQLLKDLNVIMRAGICEFVFIHWKYISPWVIATYNVKRLEKESMEPVKYHLFKIRTDEDVAATSTNKRKLSIDEETNEPAAKLLKDTNAEPMPSTSSEETNAEPMPSTSSGETNAEPKPSTSSGETNAEPMPSTSSGETNAEPKPSTSLSGETNAEPKPNTSSSGKTKLDKVTIDKNDATNLPSTSAASSRTTFLMRVNPWIRVNGGLNRRVLDKWLGSLLAYCIASPGSIVLKICQRFNLQQPIHIRLLLEYLEQLECIELKTITSHKATLWSCNQISIESATELDTIDKIFVNVKDDAIAKMSTFIGDKQYSVDFI